MGPGVRWVLRILLVVSLLSFSATARLPEVIGLLIVGIGLILGSLCAPREVVERTFFALLGFFTPLLALLGPHLLLGSGLIFFLLRPSRAYESQTPIVWAAPFGVYLLGALIGEAAFAFNVREIFTASFIAGVRVDGVARLLDVWNSLCSAHTTTISLFRRALLFVLLVSYFSIRRDNGRRFALGLLCGVGISALFTLVQWAGWVPLELPNQTRFWRVMRRLGGLMTDPNALGVVMGLSLWVWAWQRLGTLRRMTAAEGAWLILVVFAGAVAGSRTFLLLVVSLLGASLWRYRRGYFVGLVGMVAVAIGLATALDSQTALFSQVDGSSLPEGVKRGLHALSLLRIKETLFTRSLFIDLARLIGDGHWMFGIGADHFRYYVPLVGATTGIIRSWTDNANNFYLGVVVELGLLGGLFLLLTVLARSRRLDDSHRGFSGWLLLTIAVILCTGPHLDFVEVLLVVAYLVGSATQSLVWAPSLLRTACLVAVVAGFAGSLGRERGVYAWSEEAHEVKRWLSNRAAVEVLCNEPVDIEAPSAELMLQAMYIPTQGPLVVRAFEGATERGEIVLTSQERQSLAIPCGSPGERVLMTLVTSPPWSPYRAWPGRSGDRRLLGVQQFVARVGAP
jgi:hypothetical protein